MNISILGDSISTFAGFTQPGGVYYAPAFAGSTGVSCVEETWWRQVISALGGRLLGNSSWSGSTVAREGYVPAGSPSRLSALAPDGGVPDLILVFTGLNDVNCGIPPAVFAGDYGDLLRALRSRWPAAEIVCGTLLTGYLLRGDRQLRPFPAARLEPYNRGIRHAVRAEGCRLAELAQAAPYRAPDGFHPDGEGMAQLARLWLAALSAVFPSRWEPEAPA